MFKASKWNGSPKENNWIRTNFLVCPHHPLSPVFMGTACKQYAFLPDNRPALWDDSARSKWDESDFESLVLEDPSFSFLQAQEFFLSDDASCERTLDIKKPLKVPVNEKSKRAQLQQRYVVKHIKDALMSVAKMDSSKSKKLQRTFIPEGSEYEGVPPVELHMYPRSLDVNSTWRVLLIPRIQELFGETVFLCNASSSKTSSPKASSPCVAKLTFNALPLRLLHLVGRWSPSLDPLRRAPHELLLSMELLLLAIILFMLWHVLDPLQKLLRMAWEFYNTPKDYLKKKNLLESSLPKTWMLLQHAYVYKAAGETELAMKDALDACTEVKALLVMCSVRVLSKSQISNQSKLEKKV